MDYKIVDKIENKSKVAIVAVGYNRLQSMKRLLSSIASASYSEDNVPLVISIDASGDEELYSYVRSFQWEHGEKIVNIETKRLGLVSHIFQCCSLTKYFKAVTILEDDLYVSPYFYDYICAAVDKYGSADGIAGISLYTPMSYGYANLPFIPQRDGSDTFLYQDVSTWGECFTENMWNKFYEWYLKNKDRDFQEVQMPELIKRWSKAWSRYYNAYVVENNLTFVYPYDSYTTNFSDAGVHGTTGTNEVQVPIVWNKKDFVMKEPEDMVLYDIFANNEAIYQSLGLQKDELFLDLYGMVESTNKRYFLTPRVLDFRVIKSFGLAFRPIELNVIKSIAGDNIFLYDTSIVENNKRKENDNQNELRWYYLYAFHYAILLPYSVYRYKRAIIKHLKLWLKK